MQPWRALRLPALWFAMENEQIAAVLERPDDEWLESLRDAPPNVRGTAGKWLHVSDVPSTSDPADALGDLVERTKLSRGAPFEPDVLAALAELKRGNRAGYEALRAQLKKAGCRVMALDEVIAEESGDTGGHRQTQANILVELAQTAELFHTPDGTGFADIEVNGHRETWPVRSKRFKQHLTRLYYEETGGAPNSEALQSALNVIEAKAHFGAPERVVYIRVGGLDDKLYLDLSDETWRAIEIDVTGWRIVSNPPVRFRRTAGMKPLPMPISGGSIQALRPFLNVRSDADLVLVVAWLLAALRYRGPYPVLVISGEQGSAKSTFAAILRALVDPNTSPLRALPREDRELFIAASNGHVLAFDNVSGLPPWISDTLCRLATGGGFAVRQLYTDQDEVLFDATRPIILNGIDESATRSDLADRAISSTLEPIPEERRRPEAELWAEFEAQRPFILGALLDGVAEGLRRPRQIRLANLPRMADFALWATACETAYWPPGTFMEAFNQNREAVIAGVIDADPVAAAVRALMANLKDWRGTASGLLRELADLAGDQSTRSKFWPNSPRALANRLRRAATFLRKVGIDISFGREGRDRTRTIQITKAPSPPPPENGGDTPSASSATAHGDRTETNSQIVVEPEVVGGADDNADGTVRGDHPTVRVNPLKNNGADDADDADADFAPF